MYLMGSLIFSCWPIQFNGVCVIFMPCIINQIYIWWGDEIVNSRSVALIKQVCTLTARQINFVSFAIGRNCSWMWYKNSKLHETIWFWFRSVHFQARRKIITKIHSQLQRLSTFLYAQKRAIHIEHIVVKFFTTCRHIRISLKTEKMVLYRVQAPTHIYYISPWFIFVTKAGCDLCGVGAEAGERAIFEHDWLKCRVSTSKRYRS